LKKNIYIRSVEGVVLANVKIEGSECVKDNAMNLCVWMMN
jgi:hypothetical protein